MAGTPFSIANASPVAFTTATKTLLQVVSPAAQGVLINEWHIDFAGTVNNEVPVQVDILRQTTAGSGGSAVTPKKTTDADETVQSTALGGITTEPTEGDLLDSRLVHPQGAFTWRASLYDPPIKCPGGGRVGIRVVTPTQAGSATAGMKCQE